jgi:flagellar hook-length control protein FliK
MNMAISSTPASTGAASSPTSASASGTVSSGGFAGVLIQAIEGGSNTATVISGLALPIGLAGLFRQLGLEPTKDQSQNLIEMLANLAEQLQQQEQGDTLPPEAQDQLAALLAVFQVFIQQLGQSQTAMTAPQTKTPDFSLTSQSTAPLTAPMTSKPILQALSETLQQLSSVLSASGKDDFQAAGSLAGQLIVLLDSLMPQTAVVKPVGQVITDKADEGSSAIKAAAVSDNGVSVPKEVLNQTAVVVQESRKPFQVLRDPIWRFNVVDTENTATDGQTAIVPSISATEQSSDSSTQPAWTFMKNDTLASAVPTLGNAALPDQVPVQQFAQQIEKFLVKQFLLTQGNGTSEAKLTLNPEHLGQVDIRIIMQNGQITAQFMTDNAAARDLLDNQMSQLRSALHGQGLQVDRLDVVVQQPSSSSNASFLQQEQRQPNSGNGNSSDGRGKDGLYKDPAVFAAELERTSYLREYGYGSSLNVTA